MKINTIAPDETDFTKVLIDIAKPPKRLHYIGALPESKRPTVAIVGTRRPSSYGKEVTYRIAYDLAQHGAIIVSGLALGVDAIAHKAALDAGGVTIAVLGTPLPTISPASNRQLGESILKQGGGIISEYPEGTHTYPSHFLERNRLVAGLADAIVITEATSHSGTLNTAARALEQGKELFVVPGNITSPLSAGCNALLKQGASVLTAYEDILEYIAPEHITTQTTLPLGQTKAETTIIQLIASGLRDGDELFKRSGIEQAEFTTTLTMLELTGTIRALGANQWTLR